MKKEITSRNGKHNGKIFKLNKCVSSKVEKKTQFRQQNTDVKKSSVNA